MNSIGLVINSKAKLFGDIRSKTLDQLAESFNLVAFKYKPTLVNQITITYPLLGGNR
jgi:hypothetical protein